MKKLVYLLLGALFLASCGSDDPISEPGAYDDGIFVVNEGPFGSGTGTLTFQGDDGVTTQQVFEKENNNAILGNIAQSMIYHNEKYYIVVNNANKIIVTDKNMKAIGEITGLFFPRYMVANGNKAYVSQWGQNNKDGGIAVVDLNSLTVTKNIPTGNGPEYLLLDGNQLLVPNGGSYNTSTFENQPDSTVSIIDLGSESVIKTISVKYNPNSVIKSKNGYIVSSAEKSFGEGNGNLYFVNLTNNSATIIEGTINESSKSYSKLKKVSDKEFLTVFGGYLVTMMTIDEVNGKVNSIRTFGSGYVADYNDKRNLIYVADAKDFNQAGEIRTYTKAGVEGKKFAAGIIPGGFCFR